MRCELCWGISWKKIKSLRRIFYVLWGVQLEGGYQYLRYMWGCGYSGDVPVNCVNLLP